MARDEGGGRGAPGPRRGRGGGGRPGPRARHARVRGLAVPQLRQQARAGARRAALRGRGAVRGALPGAGAARRHAGPPLRRALPRRVARGAGAGTLGARALHVRAAVPPRGGGVPPAAPTHVRAVPRVPHVGRLAAGTHLRGAGRGARRARAGRCGGDRRRRCPGPRPGLGAVCGVRRRRGPHGRAAAGLQRPGAAAHQLGRRATRLRRARLPRAPAAQGPGGGRPAASPRGGAHPPRLGHAPAGGGPGAAAWGSTCGAPEHRRRLRRGLRDGLRRVGGHPGGGPVGSHTAPGAAWTG